MVSSPPHDDDGLDAWQTAEREPVYFSDHPHVWRMLAAAWQRGTIEFRYWGGTTPGAWRRVTPEAVFTVRGYAGIYVVGECQLRSERRTFRLDRVVWPRE